MYQQPRQLLDWLLVQFTDTGLESGSVDGTSQTKADPPHNAALV